MTERTLADRILDGPAKRSLVLNDCVRLVDDEVHRKSGLSGLAIKGGYKVMCKIKPGIIREAMDSLLDDFIARVEPFFKDHQESEDPAVFNKALLDQKDAVAEALLGITDDRARRARQATMKKIYEKLRPQAKKHVMEAIPGVARLLEKHLT